MYSILVKDVYEKGNREYELLRRILFEIRTNNVYLKSANRPKCLDDIFKITPYDSVGKKEKKAKYKKPTKQMVESAKKYGINLIG